MKRVVIIGAGYGGMALAGLLGKAGYAVDVFEKNDVLGGRIAAIKQDGFTFDIGASWYLMPEVFEQYYQLFGLSANERLEIMRLSPAYKVFFDEQPPLTLSGDGQIDRELFEAIEPGSAVRFDRYLKRSDTIYDTAVSGLLYSNFNRPLSLITLELLKKTPRMLGRLFESLDTYVSRTFSDLRLQQLLEYHSVFLGSSPFQAPSIYSLMSHLDFSSGVFYPKRGMRSLIDDLEKLSTAHGVTYHTDSPVATITTDQDRATGVTLEDGTTIDADIVVSNADLHFTETQLLAPQHRTYPAKYWSKRQPSPSGLLLSLGVQGTLPNLTHHSLFFTKHWKENFADIYEHGRVPEHASFYVCTPTKSDSSLAPVGAETLFVFVPLPANVDLRLEECDALSKRIIAELAEKTATPDLPTRIVSQHLFSPQDFAYRYNAWQNNAFGGESHLLRQSVLFRTNNQSKKLSNLYYVGAGTMPGVGLPMCLISAELAFKRIRNIRHHRPLTPEEVQ